MPPHRLVSSGFVEFWRERHLCSVTTLRADGSPHVVPMGIVLDLGDPLGPGGSDGTDGTDGPDPADRDAAGDLVAWGITSGSSQKVANLRRGDDRRVAVCQVDGRRWSTLEGVAEVREDPGSVAEAVRRYAERYRQPRVNPARVALRITVTRVLGNT